MRFGDVTLLVTKQRSDLKSFPDIYLVLPTAKPFTFIKHDLIFPFRVLTEVCLSSRACIVKTTECITRVDSEPCQTSKMELFAEMINRFKKTPSKTFDGVLNTPLQSRASNEVLV